MNAKNGLLGKEIANAQLLNICVTRSHLARALRWVETCYYRQRTSQVRFGSLTQQQLAKLVGISRQQLHNWGKAGVGEKQRRIGNGRQGEGGQKAGA